MYVCYSSSDEFSIHTCISILSLLENNKEADFIHIFLFDLGITDANKQKIQSVVEKYNRTLLFLSIDENQIKSFLSDRIPPHYGSYATYARLCATILFPPTVDRILYLDSDMVIVDSLSEIYHVQMGDKLVACVPQKRDAHYMEAVSIEEANIIKQNKLYMNAGLLLINISNWRRQNFNDIIQSTIEQMHEFRNKDQSILNFALKEDQIFRLPFRYNYTMHRYPQYLLKNWAKRASPLTAKEVLEAAKHPAVIHYCGDQSRPWYSENTSCFAYEYYKYKNMSPYADVPLESIFATNKFKNASGASKAFMRLYYKTHQSLLGLPLFLINQFRIHCSNQIARRNRK